LVFPVTIIMYSFIYQKVKQPFFGDGAMSNTDDLAVFPHSVSHTLSQWGSHRIIRGYPVCLYVGFHIKFLSWNFLGP
jgi:hypothetical protein